MVDRRIFSERYEEVAGKGSTSCGGGGGGTARANAPTRKRVTERGRGGGDDSARVRSGRACGRASALARPVSGERGARAIFRPSRGSRAGGVRTFSARADGVQLAIVLTDLRRVRLPARGVWSIVARAGTTRARARRLRGCLVRACCATTWNVGAIMQTTTAPAARVSAGGRSERVGAVDARLQHHASLVAALATLDGAGRGGRSSACRSRSSEPLEFFASRPRPRPHPNFGVPSATCGSRAANNLCAALPSPADPVCNLNRTLSVAFSSAECTNTPC